MKKLALITWMIMAVVIVTKGQYQDTAKWEISDHRQKIQIGELPESIKIALESQNYTGWTISAAYRSAQIKKADKTKRLVIYVVELRSGPDIRSDKFDQDGNRLDDKLALRE